MSERTTSRKQKPKTKVVKDAKIVRANARLREKPQYKSFRLHKRVKHHEPGLPNSYTLAKKALKMLWQNRRRVAVFTLVYGALYLLFIRGVFNPINIDDLRFQIESTLGEGSGSSFEANRLIFGSLTSSFASGLSGEQGVFQAMLLVISSLALIWLFRQQQAGNTVSVKMAFYRGMYPLIPFFLVGVIIVLQLLPGLIGNFLYATVVDGGIAVNGVERFVWLLLYLALLLLSAYLISSSLIALMVVTLPEMTPFRALKKAKQLTTFRRFSVFRKTTGLLIVVGLLFISIVFPALFLSAVAAQLLFLLLSILTLPFVIAYLYVLYRELL